MLCLKSGEGPGKTTSTMGNFLHGFEVLGGPGLYVAFDKVETTATEKVLFNYRTLYPDTLKVSIYGEPRLGTGPKGGFRFYTSPNGITDKDLEQANSAYTEALSSLKSGEYKVIACDELITVVEGTLLTHNQLEEFCAAAYSSQTLVWVSGSPLGRERKHQPETLSILHKYAAQWVDHSLVKYAWPYPLVA
jgi:ATP:corrinoid adenosyltransferase